MHMTTQKQQEKAYRHYVLEERIAIVKYFVKSIFKVVLFGLAVLAPSILLALGWIKD